MRIRHLLLSLCAMGPLAATALAADVAGRWNVRISTAEGAINGLASLKQAGHEVTGWVGPNENDPIPIAGTFKKGKLVMKTRPQPGRTVAFDEVELSIKADTMSGAFERGSHGKGTIKFVRSMNPWFAKAIILASSIAMVIIRAPHGQRSRGVKVVRSSRGALEIVLLTLAWLAFFVPLVWIVAPVFAFADYSLRPLPLAAGVVCLAVGLWLFARSHADLGTNWSITLEVREKHQLVTHGIYRSMRHPMYSALLLYSIGQALVVPNWIAGPSYAVAMALLFAFRVGPEERMMLEEFGKDYEAYTGRTKRLVPGIW